MDDQALIKSAMRAYYRTPGVDQPSGQSGVERADDGRDYVGLRGGRDASGICAVYSVQPDKRSVRRVKQWPADRG
ncbi:MAG: hypothetical protein V4844_12095 [Pseudomonadota bacterium]